MFRAFLLSLFALVGVSCNEEMEPSSIKGNGSIFIKSLKSIPTSRTEIGDDTLTVNWTASDILGVFMKYDGALKGLEPYAPTSGHIGNAEVTFTGGHSWVAPSAPHTFYAYYPYDENRISSNPSTVPVTLPANQVQIRKTHTHINNLDFLFIPPTSIISPSDEGEVAPVHMSFKHTFAMIKLQIKATGFSVPQHIQRITLESISGNLAVDNGIVDITLPADDPAFGTVQDGTGSNTITLDIQGEDNVIPSDGETFFPAYMLITSGDKTATEEGIAKTMRVTVETDKGIYHVLKAGFCYKPGHRYIINFNLCNKEDPWNGNAKEPAKEDVEVWSEEKKQNETLSKAYVIYTPEELFWLSQNELTVGKAIVIKSDLDLGGRSWNPIGGGNQKLNNDVYGLGHTISGLFVEGNHPYAGLFGQIGSARIIQNLHVTGMVTSTAENAFVGGIVGYYPAQSGTVRLDNVSFHGKVEGNSKNSIVGGILGKGKNLTIVNGDFDGEVNGYIAGGIVGESESNVNMSGSSVNKGNITGSYIAGGIVGRFGNGLTDFKESFNYGHVTGGIGSEGIAGGIIGHSIAHITLSNCYGMGGTVTGYTAGGIIGKSGTNGKTSVASSYNTGKIIANSSGGYGGGLVGYGNCDYTNCYNTGDVDGYIVGGLGGYDNPNQACEMNYCFNRGRITGGSSGGALAGGLIGYGGVHFRNAYNVGAVTARVAGGFIGHSAVGVWQPKVTNSYNIGVVTPYTDGFNQIYGLLTSGASEMKVSGFYCNDNKGDARYIQFGSSSWPSNWDSQYWKIGGWYNGNPEYPKLRFEP